MSILVDTAKEGGILLYKDSDLDIYKYRFNGFRDLIVGINTDEIVFMFGLSTGVRYDLYKYLQISKEDNDLVFSFLMIGGEKFICNISCDRYVVDSRGYLSKG